ncbi:hypothetical protein [Caloranaerobacter sp. DY30410]|uniref:hypothetical protein n=1 Tax=Caloranaerobacter sp. DY30410 TaxID=3238305 RepID=UPI003D03CB94
MIGYEYGIHSFGGNLYVYDLQNNETKSVKILNSANKEVRLIEVFDNIIYVTISNRVK